MSEWRTDSLITGDLDESIRAYKALRKPATGVPVCHAPFVSLNIEQSGKATACCYNREQILGTWPENSLQEIWKGVEIAKLRAQLSKDELPSGCWLCREQLLAKNFGGLQARLFDPLRDQPAQPGPLRLELEMSNLCNLECAMCTGYFSSSIRKNREKLPPRPNPFDDRFVEQLAPWIAGLREVKFLGGEPFLNPLYYKIWALLIDKSPRVSVDITTNGTVLLEKTKRVIRALLPTIMVSVDSLQRKTYESIRVNASYKELRRNLDWMMGTLKAGGREMGLTVCPMRMNWQDLPELVSFCNRNQLHVYFNTVVNPPELSLRTVPPGELQDIIDRLAAASIDPGEGPEVERFRIGNMEKFSDLIQQLDCWKRETSARGQPLRSPPFLGRSAPEASPRA